MTIFVTGAYGLVGSRFVELNHKNFEIYASDRGATPPFALPCAQYIPCDITDERDVRRAISDSHPDVILHFAAFTDVDGAEREKGNKDGLAWRVNVVGSADIANAAKRVNAHLLMISTGHVFDGSVAPNDESAQPHPINWYGVTKREAELAAETIDPNICITRIHYPYRAHFDPKIDFIRSMLAKLHDTALPPMFTDQKITPTFIDDIARGLVFLIEKKVKGFVHLVGASSHTPYEIAQLLAPHMKTKRTTLTAFRRTHPDYAPRPKDDRLISKRLQALGIKMHTFPATIPILRSQGLKI